MKMMEKYWRIVVSKRFTNFGYEERERVFYLSKEEFTKEEARIVSCIIYDRLGAYNHYGYAGYDHRGDPHFFVDSMGFVERTGYRLRYIIKY